MNLRASRELSLGRSHRTHAPVDFLATLDLAELVFAQSVNEAVEALLDSCHLDVNLAEAQEQVRLATAQRDGETAAERRVAMELCTRLKCGEEVLGHRRIKVLHGAERLLEARRDEVGLEGEALEAQDRLDGRGVAFFIERRQHICLCAMLRRPSVGEE